MENKINAFLDSIITNFPDIKFEIVHNSFSPTLKHLIIRDSFNGKGFGSSHDYLEAIHKAYSEFIERKTFLELGKMFNQFETSNGFSAHVNSLKANEASTLELIERDAFFLAWHSKTPPYWLTNNEVKSVLYPSNFAIAQRHAKIQLKLKLGFVAKSGNIITCIVCVSGKRNGKPFFYIDTKAGENISRSMNHLVEGIAFFSHFLSRELSFTKKKVIRNPIDHFYYFLNYSEDVDWFHKGSKYVLEIPSLSVKTSIISPEEILGLTKLKRVVSFAEADSMQSYYCGKFNLKNINYDRFINVFGKDVTLNKQTHPLS